MSDPFHSLELLCRKRDLIRAELAQLGDLRPGSLVERYRKCGKPSRHCAQKGDPGHGPSYSLTRPVQGKTVTHIIPPGPAVERTREQSAEYRRFRDLVRNLRRRRRGSPLSTPRTFSGSTGRVWHAKRAIASHALHTNL